MKKVLWLLFIFLATPIHARAGDIDVHMIKVTCIPELKHFQIDTIEADYPKNFTEKKVKDYYWKKHGILYEAINRKDKKVYTEHHECEIDGSVIKTYISISYNNNGATFGFVTIKQDDLLLFKRVYMIYELRELSFINKIIYLGNWWEFNGCKWEDDKGLSCINKWVHSKEEREKGNIKTVDNHYFFAELNKLHLIK